MRFRRIVTFHGNLSTVLTVLTMTIAVLLFSFVPKPETPVDPAKMLQVLCFIPGILTLLMILGLAGSAGVNRWLVPKIGAPLTPLKKLLKLQESIQ